MQLAKEAKQLDTHSGKIQNLKNLVREITQESGARASLELINELGILVKKSAFPKNQRASRKIIEILYKYLGSKDIDELYQNLKDVSSVPLKTCKRTLMS